MFKNSIICKKLSWAYFCLTQFIDNYHCFFRVSWLTQVLLMRIHSREERLDTWEMRLFRRFFKKLLRYEENMLFKNVLVFKIDILVIKFHNTMLPNEKPINERCFVLNQLHLLRFDSVKLEYCLDLLF